MFENVLVEFATLAGFAALVTVIVNVLKFFGVVKDGTADKWVAGFNLVGFIALYVVRHIIPDFNPIPIDSTMGEIALVGGYVLSYVTMLLGSKLTYVAVKGLPFIGKSNSGDLG